MSIYRIPITARLEKMGRKDIDPRHVEGYMRCVYGTLDSLEPARFTREVKIAVRLIDQDAPKVAEGVALSYGLRA